ncbi:MAG TPA: GNAT family N-acetyltransferase [Ktedonobacteraceae bacterium]|jgi:ribosomal protein S18 acetylase RimI-like enzyme
MAETALFAWATQRFRELDQERGKPLPYWVEFRDDDTERRLLAEAQGFLLDEDYHYIQFHHSLSVPLADPIPPDGFLLRQLKGEQEVSAYAELHRAAFASTSMTPDWRARTLRMPQYRPELDLVAVAPDGSLAGFCVGWLDQKRHLGQIEPLGVHPRFHQMGLGRALLLEMLRRFKIHGATSALVETENTRLKAQRTYESVGFRPLHTILLRGKWVNATPLSC